jgi:hypothetical protein
LGWIQAQPHPLAAAYQLRKKAKLIDSAGTLVLEPGTGQSALAHRHLDQIIAQRSDLRSNALEKKGARLEAAFTIGIETCLRAGTCARDILCAVDG